MQGVQQQQELTAPHVRSDRVPVLRDDWKGHKLLVKAQQFVEHCTVHSMVCRQHPTDSTDLEPGDADDATKLHPVAWFLLIPYPTSRLEV